MEAGATIWHRLGTLVGFTCLGLSLALLPAGVDVVRADDLAEAPQTLMSIDPALVEAQPTREPEPAPPAALPNVAPGVDLVPELAPGTPGAEIQPGVMVLNTRGYNYGPPPSEVDPAAMQREGATP